MEIAVRNDRFEESSAVVSLAVFGVGEPAEEVLRGIVEQVFDEMMTDAFVGLAFAVDEGRSFPIEDLAHERMTGSTSMMPHTWSIIPPFRLFFAIRGRINVR